jgi:hypothetical protein
VAASANPAVVKASESLHCSLPWTTALSEPHAANHHSVALVQLSFDFYMLEANAADLSRASLHSCNGNAAYSFASNIASDFLDVLKLASITMLLRQFRE